MPCSLVDIYRLSDERAASIFCVDRGCTFLTNSAKYLPDYTASHPNGSNFSNPCLLCHTNYINALRRQNSEILMFSLVALVVTPGL
jgi:hypothetical protein